MALERVCEACLHGLRTLRAWLARCRDIWVPGWTIRGGTVRKLAASLMH